MNLRIRLFAAVSLTLLAQHAQGQIPHGATAPRELGRPFITNYTPKEYGAHAQNQAVVQDSRGMMYFANASGVLEYDGASWRLLPAPSKAYIRSLNIDKDQRIYAGGQGDLGYLAPDSTGHLHFLSLLDELQPEDRLSADILATAVNDEGVYFRSDLRLFRWTGGRMKVWRSNHRFLSSFLIRDRLYLHQADVGLLQMVGDSLIAVRGGERFAGQRVDAMLPYDDGKILIATRTQGFFLYDGHSFVPLQPDPQTSRFLLENELYDGFPLPDGTFALATVRGGVLIIDKEGHPVQKLDVTAGVLGNFARYVYADRHGSLWLALDNGIARVETPSPLTFYDKKTGLDSYVVYALRHNGTLHVATGEGVYSLNATAGRFRHVPGLVARSWVLLPVGRTLLVGTSDGVYRIDNNKATVVKKSIAESFSVYSLYRSKRDTNLFLVGLRDGLATLQMQGSRGSVWSDGGRIQGISEPIRTILETAEGDLWLGTQAQGVLRLRLNGNTALHNPTIERYGPEQGLPKGGVSVFSIEGRTYFAMIAGVFQFDEQRRIFHSDSTFAMVSHGGSQEEYSLKEDGRGNVWINFGKETALATRQSGGSFEIQTTPFRQIRDLPNYFIYPEGDGVVWVGSEESLIRYDPHVRKNYGLAYPALIRRVTATGDSIIYDGTALPGASRMPVLAHSSNALRFEFSATSFAAESENRYQTFLEGFDETWAAWNREARRDYTNLPEGTYTFHVRAKNIYERESLEAVYSFTILSPWHRTWWAYAGYVLLVGLTIFTIDRWQRRRLISRERENAQFREAQLRAEAAEALARSEGERKKNVELLSEIGKDITASLDMETIFVKLYEHVNQLMDAAVFGVGIYHPEEEQIEYRIALEKGKRYAPYTRDTRDKNQFPVWCIEHRQPVFINDVEREYGRYISTYTHLGGKLEDGTVAENPSSLIYLPLISQDRVLGVITIQSFQKNAYNDLHLNLLQNLAAYTSIALDNADAYRRLNATLDHLKAAQQQLVTQEKLASLGQLTAGIAHEIKNPLNFVNNFAQLSGELIVELREELEKLNGQEKSREDINDLLSNLEHNARKINEHGKRADGIVQSMLRHSRGQANERQESDVNSLLEESLNLAYHGMRAQNSEFNVKMEKDFDPTVGKVSVVPQDISRVFLNILTNGFYETHKKKKQVGSTFEPIVHVRTKNLGEGIEVRIRDNANGIPKEIQEKVFNPFFTTKPTGQGTGLGLSLSYDIVVKGHRGDLLFETEEGAFTEFIIRLPRKG